MHHALHEGSSKSVNGNLSAITVDGKPLPRFAASRNGEAASCGPVVLGSPWFRTAFRTATAIAITVLIVRG